MTLHRTFHPPGWQQPPGYSHAFATSRPLLFVSGQVPLDASGALVGGDDLGLQTAQVFENLETVLAEAGAELTDIVKLTYFVVGLDADKLAAIRRVRDRFLGEPRPASSLVGVTMLFRPDVIIEIEAIVALPA